MNLIVDSALSLFAEVDQLNKRRLFANYRGSLVTISHQIEDAVLHAGTRARIFAGFQKMSYFLPQLNRYRRLGMVAEQIWVFGVPDCTLPVLENVHFVPLGEDDALVKEWFLVADSPEYFSALVAQDLSGFEVSGAHRKFRGIWTFDADQVKQLQVKLSNMVGLLPFTDTPRDYRRQLNQISLMSEGLIDSLEARNAQLRQTQELREDLTSMLVHDLRNPLTVVISAMDLVERAARNGDYARVEQLTASARSSGQDLRNMISDMLDINRLAAGELRLQRVRVAIPALFDVLRKRYQPLAELENKTFRVIDAPPEAAVTADYDHLVRALENLVANAFKYSSPAGTITLYCTFDVITQGWQLIVSDDGLGIPADQLAHIFDKYRQVTGRGDERRGFGLGLTFVKTTIEAQGGVVSVTSTEGVGSKFIIALRKVI